jgi:hypothetical protein
MKIQPDTHMYSYIGPRYVRLAITKTGARWPFVSIQTCSHASRCVHRECMHTCGTGFTKIVNCIIGGLTVGVPEMVPGVVPEGVQVELLRRNTKPPFFGVLLVPGFQHSRIPLQFLKNFSGIIPGTPSATPTGELPVSLSGRIEQSNNSTKVHFIVGVLTN